jgi:hypothetical protein
MIGSVLTYRAGPLGIATPSIPVLQIVRSRADEPFRREGWSLLRRSIAWAGGIRRALGVAIVKFWTYSCMNHRQALPSLRDGRTPGERNLRSAETYLGYGQA